MKLNLGCGDKLLDGFVNLDKQTGWTFERGLNFPNGSIDGITISHALMYLPINDWRPFLKECYRVLKIGGVIRITEDNTTDKRSERYGGYYDAITKTDPLMCDLELRAVGFRPELVDNKTTHFIDKTLMQEYHGKEPKVFFMEGIKHEKRRF